MATDEHGSTRIKKTVALSAFISVHPWLKIFLLKLAGITGRMEKL
jgi:hypothetical protein